VMPGTYIRFDRSGSTSGRYWKLAVDHTWDNMTFEDAMNSNGRVELAEALGGEITEKNVDLYNESIDLTPIVKDVVKTGGTPLSGKALRPMALGQKGPFDLAESGGRAWLHTRDEGADLFDMPPARTEEQIEAEETTKEKRRATAEKKLAAKRKAESAQGIKDKFMGIIDSYKELYANAPDTANMEFKNDYSFSIRLLVKTWQKYVEKGLPIPADYQER
jgi:hypothetical protein